MTDPGSVTQWVEQLRSGDTAARERAAQMLWQRHFARLLALAYQHLDKRLRRREDEHDIVGHVYASFCVRLQRGDFSLQGREDLWRLLSAMTLRKTYQAAERHRCQRRDYRREVGTVDASADLLASEEALERLADRALDPAEEAEMKEDVERRIDQLPQPLQQIVYWKLQDCTNGEIANRLHCNVRTVERKLQLIRDLWQAQA
jgi:RNA polymerase sigma factor (sigma-70 family)